MDGGWMEIMQQPRVSPSKRVQRIPESDAAGVEERRLMPTDWITY